MIVSRLFFNESCVFCEIEFCVSCAIVSCVSYEIVSCASCEIEFCFSSIDPFGRVSLSVISCSF